MELVREEEYDRRFDEYMQHVVAFNQKETVYDARTGRTEPPNLKMMAAVEKLFGVEADAESWRKDLVGRIGAHAVDHPEEQVNFRALFPDLLRAVKDDFFKRREEKVSRLIQDLLRHGSDDFDRLPDENRELVATVLRNLEEKFGYCPSCARSAAAFLAANPPA
jgi:predicted Ser/Thr protein kinase